MNQITYDIKDWLRNPFKWNYFTYIFRRPFYKLRLLYRISKIKYWGAWEMVEPMLEIPFEIFCEFYEHSGYIGYCHVIPEGEHDRELCENQNKAHDEMDRLYKWYKEEMKVKKEELDYLLHLWCEHHVSWWSPIENNMMQHCSVPNNKYADYLFNLLQKEEKKFEQEKEDNLISLMKLRNRLWD